MELACLGTFATAKSGGQFCRRTGVGIEFAAVDTAGPFRGWASEVDLGLWLQEMAEPS